MQYSIPKIRRGEWFCPPFLISTAGSAIEEDPGAILALHIIVLGGLPPDDMSEEVIRKLRGRYNFRQNLSILHTKEGDRLIPLPYWRERLIEECLVCL